jgi:hypothetical protein
MSQQVTGNSALMTKAREKDTCLTLALKLRTKVWLLASETQDRKQDQGM